MSCVFTCVTDGLAPCNHCHSLVTGWLKERWEEGNWEREEEEDPGRQTQGPEHRPSEWRETEVRDWEIPSTSTNRLGLYFMYNTLYVVCCFCKAKWAYSGYNQAVQNFCNCPVIWNECTLQEHPSANQNEVFNHRYEYGLSSENLYINSSSHSACSALGRRQRSCMNGWRRWSLRSLITWRGWRGRSMRYVSDVLVKENRNILYIIPVIPHTGQCTSERIMGCLC